MRQLSLSWDRGEAWDKLRTALDNAVTHLGLKEVTFKLDVAKSTLCDALHDRNDRRWAQEWTLVVLSLLTSRGSESSDQLAKEILDAQAEVTSRFAVVLEDDEPTPEEIAAAERVITRAKRRRRAA